MKNRSLGTALFCEDETVQSQYLIHTSSPFERTNLLYLQEVGMLKASRPYTTGRHGLESFLFFIVLNGSGEFVYDSVKYALNTGDCVFIDCRKEYFQICGENPWTLRWVHFNSMTMEAVYEKYIERGGRPVFRTECIREYQELLSQIYLLAGECNYLVNMELAEKLSTLLVMLAKETQRAMEAKRMVVRKLDLEQVKKYLEDHYREPISLDSLAERFYIDKYYLTKIFKTQYDATINNYLNQIRIRKAKQLLRFSDLPIEKIGEKVGISEPNYFARVFKKIEGVSPSAYRAQW